MRALLLLCLTTAATLWCADNPPKTRLSEVENIEPKSYRADLTLDPGKDTFSGRISIRMELKQPLQTIWLNQEQIHIDTAVVRAGGKDITAEVLPGGDDFVGLRFPSAIPSGEATASIRYSGRVKEKNSSGIFRQQEAHEWYIFSQFEASDARAAFPCFDEPSYKTPWQLTLHLPQKDHAISNTPIVSETPEGGGLKKVVFKETKPLPSYLVAFGVGPFEFVDAGTAGRNKVPVRIVVPRGRTADAKYAAEVTATILTRLENYFGIPYPYEKADQVAIPNTAGFGAMENAGMVTYAQSIILADSKVDRISRQRLYAEDAAHELAHQWFGDLVTTAWWDDVWLNEAFATWMERKLIAEWKPEWHTRVADVSSNLRAEQEDSLISARKIRQEILSKDDINNAFDTITYQKGAAVIGMFESWMGPDEFRKGVQSYLKQYSYRAATAPEFLDSLSSSSGKNVTHAFLTFLNQAGVPLVSVSVDCKGAKPALHVEQQRFLPLGSKGNSGQVWSIPLCVRYGGAAGTGSQCTLVTQPAEDVGLENAKACPTWVQANNGAVGYYRVDYHDGLLKALTAKDVVASMPATERVNLMGNERALSDAGKLPPSDALGLVDTFHADPERYVVQSAMNIALAPRRSLVASELMPNYQRFIRRNFQARARELGWVAKPDDSQDVRLLRASLVQPVATWGDDQELASQARALTEKWFASHAAVGPDMVGSVLTTAAFYGDKALFDRFLAEFGKTTDKQVRGSLLSAMNSFRDPAAIDAAMNALLRGDIPFIEGASLLFSGQQSAATRKLAFEFLKAHFDEIVAKMPTGGGFDFGADLPQVGASYCDATSRDELKAFFEPKVDKFVGARRTLDQTLEGIDLCIAAKAAQEPSVAAFLSKY